jgi:hypothetical protein
MNDSFNSYITAAKYLNKLGHKMGHAWRGNETRPPRRFSVFCFAKSTERNELGVKTVWEP